MITVVSKASHVFCAAMLAACGATAGAPAPSAPAPAGESGTIAFVVHQGSTRYIDLMNLDAAEIGSNPTRLTADPESEYNVAWSPDGKRLVYARDSGGAGIYVINADG
ncbi:MAG: TolB family protein, partial [Candidatus Binataceae bacterium]